MKRHVRHRGDVNWLARIGSVVLMAPAVLLVVGCTVEDPDPAEELIRVVVQKYDRDPACVRAAVLGLPEGDVEFFLRLESGVRLTGQAVTMDGASAYNEARRNCPPIGANVGGTNV